MSVLLRKAQAGKKERQARAMSVAKALRVSVSKVADDLFDLALVMIGCVQESCSGDELSEKLEDSALLVVMDGPWGMTAGAMVGPELVGALVQQQTMGRIGTVAAPDRKLTATDAALCAPLLDALVRGSYALLEEPEDKALLSEYRFGARCENARLFDLALKEPDYRLVRMTLDVGGGAFQSNLTLILPVPDKVVAVAADDEAEGVKAAPTLEQTVMGLHIDLWAILSRTKLPLDAVGDLQPGDVLEVSADAFDNIEFVTAEGKRIGRGAMGQIDGQRAIQMDDRALEATAKRASGSGDKNLDPTQKSGHALPDTGIIPVSDGMEMPDLPDLPDIPGEGGRLPDLPPLEGAAAPMGGKLPELPDLPDLPSLEGDGPMDLPDLPDLSDLPDLPDLPDFPDIPSSKIA